MSNLTLTNSGISHTIADEVTSEQHYRQRLHRPTVPSNGSGVTIGIGYDLGMATRAQFRADWLNTPFPMNGDVQVLLEGCIGLIGDDARKRLVALRNVSISWEFAYWVFVNRTLPRFAKMAVNTYPNLPNLNADTQAVILGLVYNRGAGVTDSSPNAIKEQRRKEMRMLQPAIASANYTEIARLIDRMRRLWDGVPDFPGDREERLRGLVLRREREAEIVRNSVRTYAANELVNISFAV